MVKRKSFLEKLIISILTVVILLNFICATTKPVEAGIFDFMSDLGKGLFSILSYVILGPGDGVLGLLQDSLIEHEDNSSFVGTYGPSVWSVQAVEGNKFLLVDAPRIQYTPITIFRGDVPLFNIDYFSNTKLPDGKIESSVNVLKPVIATWYKTLRMLAIVAALIVLIYIGIRIVLSSTGNNKAKYKDMLKDWVVGFCLLFLMHYIMAGAVKVTNAISEILNGDESYQKYYVIFTKHDGEAYTIETAADTETGIPEYKYQPEVRKAIADFREINSDFLASTTDNDLGINMSADEINALDKEPEIIAYASNWDIGKSRYFAGQWNFGYILAYYAIITYTIMFTWIYLKRAITIAFLTMIAPLVAFSYPLDKIGDGSAQGFQFWLKEYIYNCLTRPIHLLLYIVLINSAQTLADQSIIYMLVAYGCLLNFEKVIRKIFGLDKASMGPKPDKNSTSDLVHTASHAATLAATAKRLKSGKDGKDGSNGDKEKPPRMDGDSRNVTDGSDFLDGAATNTNTPETGAAGATDAARQTGATGRNAYAQAEENATGNAQSASEAGANNQSDSADSTTELDNTEEETDNQDSSQPPPDLEFGPDGTGAKENREASTGSSQNEKDSNTDNSTGGTHKKGTASNSSDGSTVHTTDTMGGNSEPKQDKQGAKKTENDETGEESPEEGDVSPIPIGFNTANETPVSASEEGGDTVHMAESDVPAPEDQDTESEGTTPEVPVETPPSNGEQENGEGESPIDTVDTDADEVPEDLEEDTDGEEEPDQEDSEDEDELDSSRENFDPEEEPEEQLKREDLKTKKEYNNFIKREIEKSKKDSKDSGKYSLKSRFKNEFVHGGGLKSAVKPIKGFAKGAYKAGKFALKAGVGLAIGGTVAAAKMGAAIAKGEGIEGVTKAAVSGAAAGVGASLVTGKLQNGAENLAKKGVTGVKKRLAESGKKKYGAQNYAKIQRLKQEKKYRNSLHFDKLARKQFTYSDYKKSSDYGKMSYAQYIEQQKNKMINFQNHGFTNEDKISTAMKIQDAYGLSDAQTFALMKMEQECPTDFNEQVKFEKERVDRFKRNGMSEKQAALTMRTMMGLIGEMRDVETIGDHKESEVGRAITATNEARRAREAGQPVQQESDAAAQEGGNRQQQENGGNATDPRPRQGNGENAPDPRPRQANGGNTPNPRPRQGNGGNTPDPRPRQGNGGNTPDPRPRQGNGGNTPDPRPRRGNGGNTPDPRPRQGNGGNTPDPRPRRGNGGNTPDPRPRQGNGGNTPDPRPRQGNGGNTPDPRPRRGNGGNTTGSNESGFGPGGNEGPNNNNVNPNE